MAVLTGTRAEFIENNLGLVHTCAGRFKGRGIEYEDLYAAGCMGLVKAYDGFDDSRGLCFSTYAVPVILGEIRKLFRDGGAVKVSRSLKELSMKAAALREHWQKTTGQDPTVSQMAQRLGVSPEQVAEAVRAGLPALSLTPVDEGESAGSELDIREESCEEQLVDCLSLKEVLKDLPRQEQALLYLRFYQNKTQSETARALHTTQVQISRRERRLLAELRKRLTQ